MNIMLEEIINLETEEIIFEEAIKKSKM